MFIEISRDFIHDSNISTELEIKLMIDFTISEIMETIDIKTMGCAVFFVNGKEQKKDYILNNKDHLRILPVFGGG